MIYHCLPGKVGTDAERFWSKVEKSPEPDGCWLWVAAKQPNGYGKFWMAETKRLKSAHHVAWQMNCGQWPPDDMQLLHKCDVRNCVRPDHLFVGTAQDNMIDKVQKGRHGGGQRAGVPTRRPLTATKVLDIRQRYAAAGETRASLARAFDVTESCIRSVVNRINWKDT